LPVLLKTKKVREHLVSIVRIIFAAIIAVSVAAVPVTGGAAVFTKPLEMSMPRSADMPCCPCCDDQDGAKSSAACALKCINFGGAILPATVISRPQQVEATLPSGVNDVLHGHVSSPPTHPPPL
jgi:hypothetical protein